MYYGDVCIVESEITSTDSVSLKLCINRCFIAVQVQVCVLYVHVCTRMYPDNALLFIWLSNILLCKLM